ncbi:eukaryotic translation initiation factor 5A-2-like [Panonychus citri]|uniref:eukaryotic translation initiation factor 5A-2-like n=1 Tax=Panonychus citri TaxID=50023 RepID=UPI002307EF58|nr:eukaryotic translation initiation factor 5A-2-like [Panonychus citri]XP_053205890.1 eukaryotic translation initiation factor 5A-2-like [Panonychus citri]
MDFEQDDSSFTTRELTYPIGCSAVKQSDIVIIDGRPCKVMEISTETGEDGEEKIHIKGEDIFNGDNHDDFCSLTEMITIAVVSDKEYELVSIEEGYCVLMDDKEKLSGYTIACG